MSTTFADGRITESSGLAFSKTLPVPDLIHTINDEATTPNIFGVRSSTGATVSTITWDGDAGLIDPEAISIDAWARIWHADLGDNDGDRPYVRFLMAPEPKTLGNHTLKFSKYLAEFEDGPRNAETFLTGNKTATDRYVISKVGTSAIYKLPPLKGNNVHNEMARMGPTFGAYVSDGALQIDDKWLLTLRRDVLDRAYIYDVDDDWSFVDDIPLADHGQTKIEGITVAPDGKSFWVSSEGSHAPLFETSLDSDFWPGSAPAPVAVPCF